MAPGVNQNSETIIDNALKAISKPNEDLISKLFESNEVKTCSVDHFDGINVKEKPVRKVIRPKVLKNHESREYLYDRLYDTPCPRNVSTHTQLSLYRV